jgi:hypothetical protein
MQRETGWRFPIEAREKRDEFLGAMPRVTLANDDAVEQPQRGEQGGGPMADVVVRLPLGHTQEARQLTWTVADRRESRSRSEVHEEL